MGKKFKKLLAMALSLAITATFCVVPMTANAETPQGETYDTADEITLSDLGLNPGNFESAISGGAHNYTSTSTSKSVAVKFKWQSHTSNEGWFVAFDADWNFGKSAWFRGGNILFCFNGGDIYQAIDTPITSGTHDVEFGRKYVTGGANTGKYYVYLIVDDELLAEGYTTFDSPANTIAFNGSEIAAQRFADYAEAEETEAYDTYDEITLSDLGLNPGSFENAIDAGEYNYTGTSTSNSVALKFKWNANVTSDGMSVFFDATWCWKAGVWFKSDSILFSFDGVLQKVITPAITSGTHDVEFGRKLVISGANKDKYYFYLIVDNELLAGGYTAEFTDSAYNNNNGMSNTIAFAGNEIGKQRFASIPETYDTTDEITLSDLGLNPGNFENAITAGEYTYVAESTSNSVALKFKWVADITSDGMSIFFDKAWNWGASVWFKGDNIIFCFNTGIQSVVTPAITTGTHDVEFGRKLVTGGKNTGKYYIYVVVDDVLLASGYTVLDSTVSKFAFNGKDLADQRFASIPETYDTTDEITLSDLGLNPGNFANAINAGEYNYTGSSTSNSVALKFKWNASVTGDGMSIFLDAAWNWGLSVWFNGDNIIFCFNTGIQSVVTPAITTGTHDVEFGRKLVTGGKNTGKYYIYVVVDDVLLASGYAKCSNMAKVIAFNGREIDNQRFADAEISHDPSENEHEGIRGDFDDNGVLDATDLATLRKILLGTEDISEMPEGIADFNNDGTVDILDLIAMKKYLAPVNTYAKSGSLALGTQEHLLESNGVGFVDNTKTAEYIADASVALGAKSYRLSMSIATLFYPTSTNEVKINTENMAKFKGQIKALKDAGIDDILYVTDAFLLPYSYHSDGTPCHNLTVPNPKTEKVKYENWLKVNANAFKKLAEECPEIKFFEPGNELNLTGVRLEKPGIDWVATETQQAAYKYTVNEKAGIVADLCWNVSNAVKSVNPANQVTTPSISVQDSGSVQSKFTDELYKAIESGAYPTNQTLGDKRIDNYFTILNIHIYPLYKTESSNITTFANQVNAFYNVVKQHNDGGSRVWITETGLSGVDGYRDESTVASIFGNTLDKINTGLAFVDTVFVYKLADVSTNFGLGEQETYYGLFYSGDDLYTPYAAKPIAKTVYSFFHNGSTNYAVLDALVTKYHK